MNQYRFIALLLALTLGLAPLASNAISFGGVENKLVDFLLEKVSIPGEFEIKAEGVEAGTDGGTVLKGITIVDATGVWFEAQSFELAWSPRRLLRGEVQIDRLHLNGGRLLRLPNSKSEPSKPDDDPDDNTWPRSPITVHIVDLQVRDMVVSEGVVPQTLSFDASGALRDEGDEQSLRLRIQRTDAVSGRILLDYLKRFDTGALGVKLDAKESAAGLVAAYAGLDDQTPVSLQIDADGPPENWAGTLRLHAQDMLEADGAIAAAWANKLSSDFDLQVRPGPRLPEAMQLVIGERANLKITIAEDENSVVRIEQAALTGSALTARATGVYRRDTRQLALGIRAMVEPDGARRLAPLIQPATIARGEFSADITGPIDRLAVRGDGTIGALAVAGFGAKEAQATFALDPGAGSDQTRLNNLSLKLNARAPYGPEPAYRKLFGEAITLDTTLLQHADRIELSDFDLTAREFALTLNGEAGLNANTPHNLNYRLTANNANTLLKLAGLTGSGRVTAQGRLAGAQEALAIRGELSSANTVLNDEKLGQLKLNHDVTLGEIIAGTVAFTMHSPAYGRGKARTRLRLAANELSLSNLTLNLLGVQAEGTAHIRLPSEGHAPRSPVGDLSFNIATLETLGRVLNMEIAGRGHGTVHFDQRDQGRGSIKLALYDMRTPDVAISSLTIEGEANHLASKDRNGPNSNLTINGNGVRANGINIGDVSAYANGPASALRIGATTAGSYQDQPLELRVETLAKLAKTRSEVTVQSLSAQALGEAIELRRPTTIHLADGTTRVEDLDLVLPDDGRIIGRVESSPERLVADIALTQIPLRLAAAFSGAKPYSGVANGTISANTDRRAPHLDGNIQLSGLRVQQAESDDKPLGVSLVTTWNGKIVDARAEVSGPMDTPFIATARLPLSATTSSIPQLPPGAELQGEIKWRGEIQPLFDTLPLSDHLLAGQGLLDVKIRGPLEAIALSGDIKVTDGRYENLVAGTIIEDIDLRTEFPSTEALSFTLTGSDGIEGTLEVQGSVQNLSANPTLNIAVKARDALLVRLDAATAATSVDLVLSGNAQATDLRGSIDVSRAEIRLLNPNPPTVIELDGLEIKGADEETGASESQTNPAAINLDIAITLADEIFVRGRGLDSEWGGNLTVTGLANAPTVRGKIEARRGYLDFIGRAFDLTKGSIAFGGSKTINPSIDVRLERQAHGITGQILVTGSAAAPELAFASNPALSEDEVLPRVLFGRSKQSLSAPEGIQLAAGVATLLSGKASVVDRARSALGVDVLRIESAENDDDAASLSVGRYVRDGVYVGGKQSLDGTKSSIVVELEVLDNVKVDADLGQNTDSSIGMSWQNDF